jgi:hypothetical protein
VAEVIQNVATPYCLDCHLDRASGHGVHTEGDGTLGVVTVAPNDTPCGGCHATASGSSAPKGEVTAGIHSDNCSLCHAGGVAGADPPAGIIVDDAVTVWNGSACVECHVDYFGDNTGGHTHVHQLTTATGCVDCHGNAVAGTNARDAIATPFVASGQVHDTLQCATCHDTAVDGALKGSAVGASATADCIDCHITTAAKTWTEIHTAALGTVQPAVDHSHANSTVSTSANCSDCHGDNVAGSDARNAAPANTPWISGGEVHAAGCGVCHTGNNDGGFRSGLTKANTIVAGNCEGCHIGGTFTDFEDVHTNATISHNVTTETPCSNCHTGDTIAGAEMHNDRCDDCHNTTNGTRVNGSANSGSYGGTGTNVGDATVNGGAGGACTACHGIYFDNHLHTHTTAYDPSPGVDRSQDANDDPCASCHGENPPAPYDLGTWSNILYEHDFVDGTQDGNGACTACHDYATRGNQTGDPGTPDSGVVTTVISNGGAVTCVTCHTLKKAPGASSIHGGHAPEDFQWTAEAGSKDTCGSTANGFGCHVDTTATNVIDTIHDGRFVANNGSVANNCQNCHQGSGGGLPMQTVGPTDGDADPGNAGSDRTAVCTDCHSGDIKVIHHTTTLDTMTANTAQNGFCVTCHKPDVGRGPEAEGNLAMTTGMVAGQGLPCNWCHLYWGGGNGATDGYTFSGSKIQMYALTWNPEIQSPGDAAGRTPIATSHAISENTTTPVSNYAACFSCHGSASAPKYSTKQVVPFHGFGTPYTGDDGTAVQDTNQIQIYAGPTNPSPDGPIHNQSRHPGFGVLNTFGDFMPLNKGDGKPYYGGTSGANYYNADNTSHRWGDQGYNSNPFEIPWNNYGGGATVSTPQTWTNFDFGGIRGNTLDPPIIVPQVPLSLP